MHFFTAELVFRVFALMCLMTLHKKEESIHYAGFLKLTGQGSLFVRTSNKHFMVWLVCSGALLSSFGVESL